MKMVKSKINKLVVLALSIMLIVFCAACSVGTVKPIDNTEKATKAADFEYKKVDGADNSSYIVITSYKGSGAEVIVPSHIDKVQVKVIGERAFATNQTITKVELPNTIKEIGKSAFYQCKALKEIIIPVTVEDCVIEDWAFAYCSALQKMEIPSSVVSIGDKAFRSASALEEITIPSSVKTIGTDVLYMTSKLKKINIVQNSPADEALKAKYSKIISYIESK